MNILMVCLGNICRSPLAQGILESKISEKHKVDSAGTAAWHVGKKPDSRSIEVAKHNGIDISNQKARQISSSDFKNFDLIYVMDQSNFINVLNLAKSEEEKSKVKLILNEIGEEQDVPDPYYGGEQGFINVYDLLDKATDAIVKQYHLNK